MDYADLARRLKSIREDAGLTLDELAERMQFGRAGLAHYEAQRRKPDLERITEWAEACGYEAELVFRRAGSAPALTALYSAASGLDPGRLRLLARIAALLRHADPDFLVTLGIEIGLHEARLQNRNG